MLRRQYGRKSGPAEQAIPDVAGKDLQLVS